VTIPASVKTIYRIFTWVTLAALVLTLLLILHKSPAPDVPYDALAAATAGQKFEAAEQAKAAGLPAQVQLDRTELNSFLAQNLALQGSAQAGNADASSAPAGPAATPGSDQLALQEVQSSVKDVKVDMDGDLIKAYVIFDFHGKDLSLELEGHVSTQDGYLKFDPVAGKLGSMPLPQSTLDSAVEKMMGSAENREKLRLPPDISDIQIADGQAIISYK